MNLNPYYWLTNRRLCVYGIVDLIGGLLLIVIPTHSGITNVIGGILLIKGVYTIYCDKKGLKHLCRTKNTKYLSKYF